MGYSGYMNPYFGAGLGGQGIGAVANQQAPYDYSQPIDTQGAPQEPSAKDQAYALFDQSRAAFKAGDYAGALSQCDQALQKLPNDPIMHEFRGLILFAMRRYDDAAATLYGVLSAGPGWDWTTMISLYPSIDVYTPQLRALEEYTQQNPQSAAGHFDLAYQYLAQGQHDAAVPQLEQVVRLNPQDTLSPKLLQMFSKGAQSSTLAASPAETAPAKTFDISGTWTANPAQDTTITLTVGQDGKFAWNVASKGKSRDIGGNSSYGNNLLTLESKQGQPLVGKVAWQDPNHFTFQAAGGGTLDPGLNFAR
jgi:tetratricopeptide (TPR) repeat protein